MNSDMRVLLFVRRISFAVILDASRNTSHIIVPNFEKKIFFALLPKNDLRKLGWGKSWDFFCYLSHAKVMK